MGDRVHALFSHCGADAKTEHKNSQPPPTATGRRALSYHGSTEDVLVVSGPARGIHHSYVEIALGVPATNPSPIPRQARGAAARPAPRRTAGGRTQTAVNHRCRSRQPTHAKCGIVVQAAQPTKLKRPNDGWRGEKIHDSNKNNIQLFNKNRERNRRNGEYTFLSHAQDRTGWRGMLSPFLWSQGVHMLYIHTRTTVAWLRRKREGDDKHSK